ncbi:CheR family methyltransferase [Pueribacillus sp. YX66]|uniref:CheR family methyltransferase n=1 Tax=Pueribacillus sp. YX66 TaxID=3229242 RepID=UPI00358D3AE1
MGDYNQFIQQIKSLLHLDLDLYKEAQMKRRLTSFRERKGYTSFHQLYTAMENDFTLQSEFLDRVTINVSEFFRNYKRWEILETKILPNILEHKSQINVWSAACSTGEEPYTLAIILANFLPLHSISILATDIDAKVIEKAKIGRYSEHSLKEVPTQIKNENFTKINSNEYEVNQNLKKIIQFRDQDLFQSSYHQEFDLIVCRNVLIYFTEEAKQRLYCKFNRALKKDGILFVGSTEQIFQPQNYGFTTEDTFFYRKISSPFT